MINSTRTISSFDFNMNTVNIVRKEYGNCIFFRSLNPKINLDTKIYRYIPLKYLYDLIDTQKLYISNRKNFSDISEITGEKKFIPTPRLQFPVKPASSWKNKRINQENERLIKATLDLCISCWSAEEIDNQEPYERFLMWKAYGYPQISCRIGSTIRQMIEQLDIHYDIIVSDVSYNERECSIPDKITFNKNKFYQDEKEVRLVVIQNNLPYIFASIHDVRKLINEITLSPFIDPHTEYSILHSLKDRYPHFSSIIKQSLIMEY